MQKIRVVELGFKAKGIPGNTNLQSLNDLNRDDSDSSTSSVNTNRCENRNDNNTFCINTDNSNGVDSNISSNNSNRLEFEIDNNNIDSIDDSEHEVVVVKFSKEIMKIQMIFFRMTIRSNCIY